MKRLSTYLPPSFSLAGERGVNDGEKEGGLERRNGRMRVFIGSRVADISILGTIDREERRLYFNRIRNLPPP